MSQLSKPKRTRTNATSACKNCRASHRRCERLFKEDICMHCRNNRLHCTYTLGRKRGPKARFLNFQTPLNKLRETNIEELQFSSHLYNNNITTPFFKTTDAFIDQEPTSNNPNTTPTNSYEITTEEFQSFYLNFETAHTCTIPFFRTAEAILSHQNTTQINSHEIVTEEFQFPSLNVEIPYPYDGVIIIPFRTTEVFINQEQAPNNPL